MCFSMLVFLSPGEMELTSEIEGRQQIGFGLDTYGWG